MEVTLSHILLREMPILLAVTFLFPCHSKANAPEAEQSDYHCAQQGLFAAATTPQSECCFCLHSSGIKNPTPRYYMLCILYVYAKCTHFTLLEF